MTGFFVLSGFIMAHVYQHTAFTEPKAIGNYYLKRIAKIYPAYAVASAVFPCLVGFINGQTLQRYVLNDLLLIQGFFGSMFPVGLNGATWSLTVEALLYFLFPFLMLLSSKSPKILWAAALLGAVITGNLLLDKHDWFYSNPVFRVSDFLWGMGVYFANQRTTFFASHWRTLHGLVLALLFVAVVLLGKSQGQYMLGQVVFSPLFALWVVCVFHCNWKLYTNRVLRYLGTISYSFYLWQEITMWLVHKTAPQTGLCGGGPWGNLGVALLLNVGLAALSYHAIEEPARLWLLQRWGLLKPKTTLAS